MLVTLHLDKADYAFDPVLNNIWKALIFWFLLLLGDLNFVD